MKRKIDASETLSYKNILRSTLFKVNMMFSHFSRFFYFYLWSCMESHGDSLCSIGCPQTCRNPLAHVDKTVNFTMTLSTSLL